jgi:hypothetical protein
MSNIVIIGCGGIGSRHLQGAAKSASVKSIQCVDIDGENIAIAAKRLDEVEHDKKVSFYSTVDDIGGDVDVCIVATPSAPRKKIIFDVLGHTNVKNFILEKIVFQNEEDFASVIEYFDEKNIRCWVNCHSRAEHRYKFIKDRLDKSFPIEIEALYPPSFNLASSMIHCLDLFCYFCNDYRIEMDLSGLDKETYDSKHLNCLEFKGTIVARNDRGDRITIKQGDVPAQTYIIKNGPHRYFSSEDTDSFTVETPNSKDVFDSKFLWQNNLTNLYIRDIISNNECVLPTLEESFEIHKAMFKNIRKHFNIKVVSIT